MVAQACHRNGKTILIGENLHMREGMLAPLSVDSPLDFLCINRSSNLMSIIFYDRIMVINMITQSIL